MGLQTDRDRGARAAALLNDELLIEAFDVVTKFYHDQWEQSPDADKRDRVWLANQSLKMVKAHLMAILNGGKLAAISLDDERKKREAQRG